ncbi:chromodomain-helicase-DNA-binding protein 1-like [Rhopilema esculentum]|uniref:chromodomain-helicase-DNA-binding protein 1-like n=1 Tax=Rhopilema esculentum TaxID=499914 RepID=UPI0031CDE152
MHKWKAKIRSLRALGTNTTTQDELTAVGLSGVVLRDYQIAGVNWLLSCLGTSGQHGCILGDEMGLGKTVQTLSFVLYSVQAGKMNHPCLIIAPLSVLQNWKSEFERWAPSVKLNIYTGDKEAREKKRNSIQDALNDKPSTWKNKKIPFDVLITSYELCLKDSSFLQRFKWSLLVVDEGHRLKNHKSLLYQELLQFDINFKLLLTGTPVQNNLREIYSLLSFLNPDVFHIEDSEEFVKYFSVIVSEKTDDINEELHALLKPFLLRRVKNEVMKELPKKSEVILYSGISSIQKKLYKAILTKDYAAFRSDGPKKTSLMNVLLQLRKCCSHPYIFPGVEPEPFEIGDHLIEASGKLKLLDKLLAFLHTSGHRVLVFSQFTMMLDIVQDYLTYKGYTYERLDGSVRGEERYLAINNFNESDETFLFLLSTKAGGQGLNLMTADTVIFLDNDFNPQNDLQAAARAHRIGQTRPVKVIRLVSKNTVEEIILKRATEKLKLTDVVIEGGQFSNLQNLSDTQTKLADILKFGLENLMNDNESSNLDEDFNSILGGTVNGEWLLEEVMEPEDAITEEEGQENMYMFEGRDYSKETSEKDKTAFDNMITSVMEEAEIGERSTRRDKTIPDISVLPLPKRKRKELTDDEKEERRQKRIETAAKRAKKAEDDEVRRALEKKKKREKFWQDNNYTSSNIAIDEVSSDESEADTDNDAEDEDSYNQIQYVVGDVTQPLNSDGKNAIIIHCVDDSGRWGSGGLFTALSKRSSNPKDQYELSGKMKDLTLGDAHLISIDDQLCRDSGRDWVALIVSQTRDRNNQLSPIKMSALTMGLERVQKEALRTKATLHLPRIGYNTPNFNWYGTERLLKKLFTSRGISTSVYYFPRKNRSSLPIATATTEPSTTSTVSKDASSSALLDIFTGKSFYFHELPEKEVSRMSRYIIAYDGNIDGFITEETTFVVVSEPEDLESCTMVSSATKIVTLEWLERCISEGRLIDS